MKLTLDLANGANYIIAKNTFEKAGYKITSYNDNPNGKNINDKCGSTYLENLPSQINKDGSSYGISMDGDGDRIAIIDKNNNNGSNIRKFNNKGTFENATNVRIFLKLHFVFLLGNKTTPIKNK